MNETTILISQIIGPIMIIFGISFFSNNSYYSKMYKNMEKESLTLLIAAMASMSLGILMILHHNLWSTPAEIIVSLFGWSSLFKGIIIALAPQLIGAIAEKFSRSLSMFTVAGICVFLLGGYLSWVGYFA